jgi:hypothetical protein
MNNWCICWFFTHIFTVWRPYKSFGIKGLTHLLFETQDLDRVWKIMMSIWLNWNQQPELVNVTLTTMGRRECCWFKHSVSIYSTASGKYKWSFHCLCAFTHNFYPLSSATLLSLLPFITLHFTVLSLVTLEYKKSLLHSSWCKDTDYSAVLSPLLTKTLYFCSIQ